VPDLVHDLDGVRRGALLRAHLHQLARFLLRFDQHYALGGIVAAWLFDVDMLACLNARDGHRRVPVVGRCDGDRIDFFQREEVAEVFLGCRGLAHLSLRVGGELLQDVALDVAHMRVARVRLVRLQG
jgi:hypothetical protein